MRESLKFENCSRLKNQNSKIQNVENGVPMLYEYRNKFKRNMQIPSLILDS